MNINEFQDYSKVLIPLPPLNGNGSVTSRSARNGEPDFSQHLEEKLGPDLSGSAESVRDIAQQHQGIFSLDSPLPANGLNLSTKGFPADNATELHGYDADELMRIAREFEGFLLSILLKTLGKQTGSSSTYSKSWEGSLYHDMFFSSLSESIGTKGPGIGIATVIYNDIIRKLGETTTDPG